MIKNSRLTDYLILLLVLFLGMWPIVIGAATMKWDAVDIYLPWKYFVGECIRNHHLPLWNPFLNSGFPQMGDVNTWYPISWVISLFRRYDVYALHFEYLFHLYLAGIGMYKVAQHYSMSMSTGIFAASAYMLCGFFISNAQHLGWIISAAWFPFIYYYFVQLRANPRLVVALKLGICSFMMLSGGYPGIFISAFYIFLVFAVFLLVQSLVKRNFLDLRRWLLYLSLSALVFLLLSAVIIVSSLDLANHVTRGGGLAFDHSAWGILTGSLPPKALLTFVFPYAASISNVEYWGTDFSIINCYMGFIPLVVMLFAVFQKEIPWKARLFMAVGILFLLIAMAQVFPVRKWIYLYLPFMNLFRFSALFRIFAIFFFLLTASYGLKKLAQTMGKRRNLVVYLVIVLGILGAAELYLFVTMQRWEFKQLLLQGFASFDKMAGIKEKMFLQGIFHMGIVAILIACLKFRPKFLIICMVSLGCADMILATRLNLYATVVSGYPVKKVNDVIEMLPQGYPAPSLQSPMIKTTDTALMGRLPYVWKNLAIYQKLPSCDGNSPYGLYTMSEAMKSGEYQSALPYPLVFMTSRLSKKFVIDTGSIDRKSYQKVGVTLFNPNQFAVKVHTDSVQYLVFQQNTYPYWTAWVNGIAQPIITTNGTYMSIKLDPGDSLVSFEFKPTKVIYAFYVSLVSFVGIIILLVISGFRKMPDRNHL